MFTAFFFLGSQKAIQLSVMQEQGHLGWDISTVQRGCLLGIVSTVLDLSFLPSILVFVS